MAEMTKKLHFLKNGTEQTAKIYTTASEAGSNYISVKVDGTTGYVPINDISHGNATMGRVAKGGSIYAILSRFAQILSYVGTATPLSVARYGLASTTIGNYALFGGGYALCPNIEYFLTVDAYNTSLTRTIPTPLSGDARYHLSATTIGNYALFGGGYGSIRDTPSSSSSHGGTTSIVDAYDASLTRTTPTPLSESRCRLSSTTIGNYALFGGGESDTGYDGSSTTVDAYNTSLTRTIPTPLSEARHSLSSISIGDYALFGGGCYYDRTGTTNKSIVDAYDASLTRTISTPLSEARDSLVATTIGNYALFGGGYSDNYSTTVDVYTVS